jgi:hypothetical protein
MTDVQPGNGTAEPTQDRTLTARRALVFVLSFALGAIVVALGIIFYLRTGLDATFPISSVEVPLWPIATLPMGFFFMIWLDYFMGTKIVVD